LGIATNWCKAVAEDALIGSS